MAKRRKKRGPEFKPDVNPSTFSKTVRLSRTQKLRLAKWFLYGMLCVLMLVLQDVLMGQLRLFGATTDLPAAVILLIAMLEGTDVGGLFLLIASCLYYFSGSAPTAYSIGLITFVGLGVIYARQMYLRRTRGSLIACTAVAILIYELALFVVGLMLGLTLVTRLPKFLLTAAYSSAALFPLYALADKIGTIGGITWKE